MTEIERILQKGVVTEDFLKEEVICDFLVTTERKKLFAVLLDMLVEFDKICKKHNLRYYLDGGTLLGAIRHKGFIPWDDDIDVEMPREDYEKFIKLGDEFKHPYFLQTPYTDPTYFYCPARIRNSNTTALVEMFAYQNFNHGVWLTILPLDNWKKEAEPEINKIKSLIIENSTYMRLTNPHLDEKNQERVRNYSGRDPFETYAEIMRLAQQFNGQPTEYITIAVEALSSYSKKLWYAEDFTSTLLADFEGYKFPIPVGYERVLRIVFGDYMALPPIEDRGLHHSGVIFDMDKPYTEYVNKLK